jgi:hypothetical protein
MLTPPILPSIGGRRGHQDGSRGRGAGRDGALTGDGQGRPGRTARLGRPVRVVDRLRLGLPPPGPGDHDEQSQTGRDEQVQPDPARLQGAGYPVGRRGHGEHGDEDGGRGDQRLRGPRPACGGQERDGEREVPGADLGRDVPAGQTIVAGQRAGPGQQCLD